MAPRRRQRRHGGCFTPSKSTASPCHGCAPRHFVLAISVLYMVLSDVSREQPVQRVLCSGGQVACPGLFTSALQLMAVKCKSSPESSIDMIHLSPAYKTNAMMTRSSCYNSSQCNSMVLSQCQPLPNFVPAVKDTVFQAHRCCFVAIMPLLILYESLLFSSQILLPPALAAAQIAQSLWPSVGGEHFNGVLAPAWSPLKG